MKFLTDQERERLKVRNRIANHFTHHSQRELSIIELQTIHTIIYGTNTDSKHEVID
jgi:hypothetical protein